MHSRQNGNMGTTASSLLSTEATGDPTTERAASSTTIVLPVPPSVNAMYRNCAFKGRPGRVKSAAYKEWVADADDMFIQQKRSLKRFTGRCALDIKVPDTMKGDISNRIKAVEDYLVSREITGDDRLNDRVSIERDHSVVDCCVVTITEAA